MKPSGTYGANWASKNNTMHSLVFQSLERKFKNKGVSFGIAKEIYENLDDPSMKADWKHYGFDAIRVLMGPISLTVDAINCIVEIRCSSTTFPKESSLKGKYKFGFSDPKMIEKSAKVMQNYINVWQDICDKRFQREERFHRNLTMLFTVGILSGFAIVVGVFIITQML